VGGAVTKVGVAVVGMIVGAKAGPKGASPATQLKLPLVPAKPLTRGILVLEDGNHVPLSSGLNGPGRTMPKGSPGFDIVTRTHVEGHAAALMRQNSIQRAKLYINNQKICPNCMKNLERMLPPGSALDVVTRDGGILKFLGNEQ